MTEDAAKAQRMLLRLSTLLRRSLDEDAREVPLRQELAFVDDYLEIQRGRFGDQLQVRMDIEPSRGELPGNTVHRSFIRVRRSAIVNLRAVASLERNGKSSFIVHLRSGVNVISSRFYQPAIRRVMRDDGG